MDSSNTQMRNLLSAACFTSSGDGLITTLTKQQEYENYKQTLNTVNTEKKDVLKTDS